MLHKELLKILIGVVNTKLFKTERKETINAVSASTWIITVTTLKRFEITGVSCEIYLGRVESRKRIGAVRPNKELARGLKSWRLFVVRVFCADGA